MRSIQESQASSTTSVTALIRQRNQQERQAGMLMKTELR